jgi:hypothetical protein
LKKLLHLSLVTCVLAAPSFGAVLRFATLMDGPSENPPVASPGTGYALVTWDTDAMTYRVQVRWKNLIAETTVAHIHCCVDPPGNVGVATYPMTFPGFPGVSLPPGVKSGTYDQTFDLTAPGTFTAAFVTNFAGGELAKAPAVLLDNLKAGRAYFNIHTSAFPPGEIRGFLTAVPEPSTMGLAGLALAGAALLRRRRK